MTSLQYLEFDNHRLAFRDVGSGPAILFLHGLGGNSASWEPQFRALADRYRVVAWDMPGFGGSDRLGKTTTTRDYSDLARRLVSSLGVTRAAGVGTSYGTVILADLAQQQPDLIETMVFACGVTGLGHLNNAERERLRTVRRVEIETMGQRKFAETRNSTYLGKNQPRELIDRVVELASSANPQGYLEAYGALTESNIFPSLEKIHVPALVISGVDDKIAPAGDCERVAAALAHSEYHCIPNAGHYVNLEQAETFNRLLKEFLARTTRR